MSQPFKLQPTPFPLRSSLRRKAWNPATVCIRCRHELSGAAQRSRLPWTFHSPRRRSQSTWTAAVNAAQGLFNGKANGNNPVLPGGITIDPLRTVAKEMKHLTGNIRQLLGSGHPMLETVARYYTQSEGKHLRPMLVLLVSQATAPMSSRAAQSSETRQNLESLDSTLIDTPISPASVLADVNPALASEQPFAMPTDASILPSQARLAEIIELIHTASLLHDDVIDHSETRRGSPSANTQFGNKMAVLAGDFLLGRASIALARLRNPEVTELIATVIANLIEGEFMQLRNTAADELRPVFSEDSTIPYYMHKTYLKSASLISKSCRAAALLSNCPGPVVDSAYAYGKNLGLAFQLVDDMLDFTAEKTQLGKPAGADLELGLATAPLLFAWRQHPELGELVGRKFTGQGDVANARELVLRSHGVEQTRALAQEHADNAQEALKDWPESQAKSGLVDMCTKVMKRRK